MIRWKHRRPADWPLDSPPNIETGGVAQRVQVEGLLKRRDLLCWGLVVGGYDLATRVVADRVQGCACAGQLGSHEGNSSRPVRKAIVRVPCRWLLYGDVEMVILLAVGLRGFACLSRNRPRRAQSPVRSTGFFACS